MESRRALYLDLELTCWQDDLIPPGMKPEIIQIGIVEANLETLTISREALYYVRPQHSILSDFCTVLTGISPERVRREGRAFREVLATIVKKFGPKSKVCFTWGDDEEAIQSACLAADLVYPFRILNLALLFRLELGTGRTLRGGMSLPNALGLLGLAFQGRPHDALVDARNTALLHIAMLRKYRLGINL